MELKKYEVDALVSEIGSGKLKSRSKNLSISDSRLQAFLKRPASGQQGATVPDGQEGFVDALLQFADTTNEIGAKAQARTSHASSF